MKFLGWIFLTPVDLFQFVYCLSRSTDKAFAFYLSLTHLDKKDNYVRMLFIDI